MRHSRAHTKSGPGRYHGQGTMTEHNGVRYVRPSSRRLSASASGGNWMGVPYLSYAEHDRCTRAGMAAIKAPTHFHFARRQEFAHGYRAERAAIVASRA